MIGSPGIEKCESRTFHFRVFPLSESLEQAKKRRRADPLRAWSARVTGLLYPCVTSTEIARVLTTIMPQKYRLTKNSLCSRRRKGQGIGRKGEQGKWIGERERGRLHKKGRKFSLFFLAWRERGEGEREEGRELSLFPIPLPFSPSLSSTPTQPNFFLLAFPLEYYFQSPLCLQDQNEWMG